MEISNWDNFIKGLKDFRRCLIMLGVGFILLLLSFFVEGRGYSFLGWVLTHDPEKYSAELLRESGFACFVAFFIFLFVDRPSRIRQEEFAENLKIFSEKLITDVSTNVFSAIYKRYIPKKLFTEIESNLFNVSLFRTDYTLQYNITAPTNVPAGIEAKEYFDCHVISRYKIHNLKDIPVSHIASFMLEMPFNDLLIDKCKIIGFSYNKGKKLTESEIDGFTSADTAQKKFEYPMMFAAGETVEFCTEAILVKKRIDDETWTSVLPSEGIELNIIHPQGLTVEARALHPAQLEHDNDSVSARVITKKWKLNHGIFPYQGIKFWWK